MDATGILVLLFGLAVFLVILFAVVKNAVREGMLEAEKDRELRKSGPE